MSPNARDPESQEARLPEHGASAPTHAQTIDCQAAARWLWDYVDARLPDASRVEMERHLTTCASCPTHVVFAHAMRRALAELRGN